MECSPELVPIILQYITYIIAATVQEFSLASNFLSLKAN